MFIELGLDQNRTLSGFIMQVIYIGYGRDDGFRKTTLYMRPAGPVMLIGSYTTRLQFAIRAECDSEDAASGCRIDSGYDARTFHEWNSAYYSNKWASWTLESNEAMSPERAKVLHHYFHFVALSPRNQVASSPSYAVRCDSADYFPGRAKACIFSDVLPHLQYRLYNSNGTNSGEHAVAQHIKDAFEKPDDAFPKLAPGAKRIPGKYTGIVDYENPNYLERIPYDKRDWMLNRDAKDRACNKKGEFALNGLPNPPLPKIEQCDEFPFASTLQGAANAFGNFSVRAVPKDDNEFAGTALRLFYHYDRILYEDLDRFFVEILDGRPGVP